MLLGMIKFFPDDVPIWSFNGRELLAAKCLQLRGFCSELQIRLGLRRVLGLYVCSLNGCVDLRLHVCFRDIILQRAVTLRHDSVDLVLRNPVLG
jgi:hypothetical protein